MAKRVSFSWGWLTILALLVPMLAACGGSAPEQQSSAPSTQATSAPSTSNDQSSAPTSVPAPATGGSAADGDVDVTVVMPYLQQGITSFDHAFWTSQLLVSQGTIFEGLYGYDPELNVVPRVAESATPNADNTVWTIKLRQDKKWSNGDPVTAHDFYNSWLRFLSPELKDAPMWAGFFGNVVNGWAFKSGAATPEELGIKLIDDYTLEISLIQPNAALINLFPVTTTMPINSASLKANPDGWWDPDKGAVFNGPYIVEKWVSGGDVSLARNVNYVGEKTGNVSKIILRPFPDANTRLQAFENGEIHFTFLEDVSQLEYGRNHPDIKDNIKEEVQNLIWRGLQYNRAVDPGPFNDIRVRQAFAHAVDKQAITDQVLRGMAVPTKAFSGDTRVTDNITALEYDVAKAQALLAEAGYPGGAGFPEITFFAPPANFPEMPVIEAAAKMWQDNLGVKVLIQNNEGPMYSTLQWNGYNKGVNPGYSTLGGPMNWFQPLDLLLNSNHIWYFMDYDEDGIKNFADYDDKIAEVNNLTAAGDWAELEARADAAWAKRQAVIEVEKGNAWGVKMQQTPTFIEQFDAITKSFNEASDDAGKLFNYQNALTLILKEEQSMQQYEDKSEANRESERLMAKLETQSLDDAWDTVVKIQQMAVDSAWMIPLYNERSYYATSPELSGIVLNKLSWGHNFQYQYLTWNE